LNSSGGFIASYFVA